MPRITVQREEAIRRRILVAAERVFVEQGFGRASIDDVVAACGMSVGAIYNYFPSKSELVRAAIDSGSREATDALLGEMQGARGPVAERLDRAFRGFWSTTIEPAGVAGFLCDAWAEAARRPPVRDPMARRFERTATCCSVFLRESVDRGELPAGLDVDTLARAFAALLEGMTVEYVVTAGSLRRIDAQKRFGLVIDALAEVARA